MQAIQRKIAAAARNTADGAVLARGLESWAAAFRRAAGAAAGMDVTIGGETARSVAPGELAEVLPDLALLVRLEGAERGIGLLAMAPDLLAALLEIRTLGRPAARPGPERRATRTDAALVADVIDAALSALDSADTSASGLRFAAHVAGARHAALLFDDTPSGLTQFSCEARLCDGARGGPVHLIVPQHAAAPPRADVEADLRFVSDMGEQVGAATVALDAVIARLTLPLGDVLSLAPGDWLRLGSAALDRIDLQGLDGVRRFGARLGQNRGMRAVRLSEEAPAAGRSKTPRLAGTAPAAGVQAEMRPTGT